MVFWFPFNVIRRPGTIGITLTIALTAAISLSVLRRGSLRKSALVYAWGMWLAFSVLIFFCGGIQSPALIFYMALPISAAWLFGYRGALWTAAGCLASGFVLAVFEKADVGPYMYFGNGRFGFGMAPNLILATLIAAVPVARVLKTLQDALAQRRRVEEELLRHQEHLQELVDQRTAELVEALDQAQAANRAKTLFLANMSHELRTPLNAILGFSDLIRRDEGVSAKQAEALGIINRSGTHLLALIDDILDMARIEAGHRVLEIATRGPDRTCAGRDDNDAAFRPSRRTWSYRSSGPMLRFAWCAWTGRNCGRFWSTWSGMRSNTPTPAPSLCGWIPRWSDDAGKVRIRIEVQDTGIGIAPEAQERIFDPFVQLSDPNARKGSGLGLAICRQFAQMMEGAIQVESEPGRGSTFRVELFAEAAEEFQAGGALEEIEAIVMVEPDQPPFRILVIEDDQANSLLLKRVLEGAGFQIRTAEDGETGIDVFCEWHPHFIWLDIHLPGMNGLEVATQIRELAGGRDVKIAALTASVFDEEREAVLTVGIDDFVRKPFRAKTVFESMERLLGVRYVRSARAAKPVTDPRSSRTSATCRASGGSEITVIESGTPPGEGSHHRGYPVGFGNEPGAWRRVVAACGRI